MTGHPFCAFYSLSDSESSSANLRPLKYFLVFLGHLCIRGLYDLNIVYGARKVFISIYDFTDLQHDVSPQPTEARLAEGRVYTVVYK